MTQNELEEAIAHLPPDELSRFRDWFLEFDSLRWDDQIASDATAGRLDDLANAAIVKHRDGKTTPL